VTLQLVPGSHRAELKLEGYDPVSLAGELARSERVEQVVQLQRRPPEVHSPVADSALQPAAAAAAAPSVEHKEASPPTAAIVATATLGAVGLITGTTLGIMALHARSDYDRHPTKAKADRGERLALFADVGFGVGAMALITTAVLVLTRDDGTTEAKPQAGLSLTPHISATGAAATAELRF